MEITQTLHLQQIISLPKLSNHASSSQPTLVPKKKPVRPQPKGLKMRFAPVGINEEDFGPLGFSSDGEEATAAASHKDITKSNRRGEKRKHHTPEPATAPTNGTIANGASPKKSKKLKDKHTEVSVAAHVVRDNVNGVLPAAGEAHKPETAEARMRRKEKRKEERRKIKKEKKNVE
jgi:DNA-directed RNA polymerase I subunit RPA34.5